MKGVKENTSNYKELVRAQRFPQDTVTSDDRKRLKDT